MDNAKPVDMVIVDPVKIDGEHIAVGTVIKQMEPELALELTGQGRAALATEANVAAATARAEQLYGAKAKKAA